MQIEAFNCSAEPGYFQLCSWRLPYTFSMFLSVWKSSQLVSWMTWRDFPLSLCGWC